MKNKLALIIAIVLGLIAVYGVNSYIKNVTKKTEQKHRTVYVATAAERVPSGAVIIPKMIDNLGTEIPDAAVTADHIPQPDAGRLVGQTINRNVERGEPLLYSYFRQPVEKLENRLEPGERAITLRVDTISGVAGNLAPGSRVDIIGTFPQAAGVATGKGAAANHTLLLLPNVRIIAVDSRTRDDEYSLGVARGRNYSTITVGVAPQEANMLVYAQQFGQLTLALRPATDATVAGTMEITDKNLFEIAAQSQKERSERLKSGIVIEKPPTGPTPVTP